MALVLGPFRTQFAQPIPQAFTMFVVLVSGTQTELVNELVVNVVPLYWYF